MKMRKIIFVIIAVIVFVVFNVLILQKERVLEKGKTVLLQLAPRDPRSLIQGDYMVLRYRIAGGPAAEAVKSKAWTGKIVIRLDRNNVARFVRVHNGETLAPGEWLLKYRYRGGLRLGAESFFFQEGHALHYSRARYGELKVSKSGESVLVGLRDREFRRLMPR